LRTVALEICERLSSQVVRFQFRTVLAPGRASRSIAEHAAIVNAIRDRDRVAAEDAMQQHLHHVASVLVELARREREAS
jgi:DNA-binding FadR family transcriptional regulator